MNGFFVHLGLVCRLHGRNRMALLYGYLFPLIFLLSFWVLYRNEPVPLLRHMGELLTVSVLGGACFGLPTTLVNERERGVWRRYRLTPAPTWLIVTSTVVARYLIILSAGLLQLAVALALGMTWPAHPFALALGFTLVSFAFIGLGLVIAMLADTVPAVQALGQCLFLPMLIIGGVAVPLAGLPDWAQHLSAFFPGRYAVVALQAAVSGRDLAEMSFCLLALALTGVTGLVAGGKLFRWDAQQRFLARTSKRWIFPVLFVWLALGVLTEWRGRVAVAAEALPAAGGEKAPWESITAGDVENLDYEVPPDMGHVAPIAGPDQPVYEGHVPRLEKIRVSLPAWAPGVTGDEVQRVRNLLCVAAIPDAGFMPMEEHIPLLVFRHLTKTYPKAKLIKLLAWIVLHPNDGIIVNEISSLGMAGGPIEPERIRERSRIYAIKFIARLTGHATRDKNG